ncbi:NAD(P)/FAD-dependent oxidoreductase [Mycobacterium xenopi]|uniref:NAD(P)/FAD-dependent oxidoreductase n=2 Tax=Mycobacterium xenopi TaxID=1789 RepID=UPI000451F458|nr:FAD-dependent oxidoreductase [Mycobacterium xenopi]EUA35767.1 NAD(P)-binding Rossmann-like domain protein [Mycobacterium xenopi 3993]MDA3641780.1 FAD-dependent oxidoreductase [Mycobacterium xenopi]MDA3659884.1 FAD-dependent oxidoreductase [Mycobacterium xenopi]
MGSTDVGVIGAGIVGLATAYALVERGVSVSVYERGVPGQGQSGGESRIFRHVHDDPRLVALAKRSRSIWEEWAQRFGTEMVSGDGVVAMGPSAEQRLSVVENVGDIPVRRIGADELHDWLPILADVDAVAVLDERGGSIRTTTAIAALTAALADRLVADEVLAVRSTPVGTLEVRAGGAAAEHDSVIVCAGRGTAGLARGMGLALPVRQGAHVRLTYDVRGKPPSTLACLLYSGGIVGETVAYAAAVQGNRRYAVGLSDHVDAPDGGTLDPAALAQLAERTTAYVERVLPGLDPKPVDVRHCWVTELPWGSDGLAVWTLDNAFFVAGHNLFKHAPALGHALAAAATGDGLAKELRPSTQLGGTSS